MVKNFWETGIQKIGEEYKELKELIIFSLKELAVLFQV